MGYQHALRTFTLSLAALSACQTNESGHLAALKGGSDHPAERGSPLESLRSACGDGASTPAGESALRRQPYLQQVTMTSAVIGWVTTVPDATRVEVTTPDDKPMTAAGGEIQTDTLRGASEHQTWATVSGLAPDTIYCYSLWRGAEQLTAPTGLRTAPGPDSTRPVRFMAFGDSGGGGSDQYTLAEQMHTVPYDLIAHTGDLAYDSGTIDAFENNVFGVYADLLRNIPFFPSSGNHEYDTMQGAPFREVFALPGDSGEKWYSYDWGRVHFVALDTEASYQTQAAWLDQDLASSSLPWKIVYFHRPPYSSGTHGSDTSLRKALAPVFERHHVQLVLSGHDHNYERTQPQSGITYVVTGGGGVGTRGVGSSSFTAFAEAVIHFVYIEVGSDELVLHAIDGMGIEFDSIVIPR